nr:immunoglobulin light chain junction region [Macaca mulatta]MPN81991.1 immunoglobulin light chain junction region [Macaca mulatta]MPN82043.1 immunoglobulin light chain junction region [Macaca mulatta]MPN82317.1 immunoglobulin light chain junction region [Macaca mulatta]MPN82444.1 immunoglobulin light chain junction region [Macaca mulatta]
YQQYNSNPLTF